MQHLEEVTVIPARDKDVLRAVRQAIHRVLPGATVYLYGSGARGTREPDSDLDLLILTDARLSRDEDLALAEAIYELELARGVVISTVQYDRAEWEAPLMRVTPFRARVDVEGVCL
jgi:predicted nucleotidyltransferase